MLLKHNTDSKNLTYFENMVHKMRLNQNTVGLCLYVFI